MSDNFYEMTGKPEKWKISKNGKVRFFKDLHPSKSFYQQKVHGKTHILRLIRRKKIPVFDKFIFESSFFGFS